MISGYVSGRENRVVRLKTFMAPLQCRRAAPFVFGVYNSLTSEPDNVGRFWLKNAIHFSFFGEKHFWHAGGAEGITVWKHVFCADDGFFILG